MKRIICIGNRYDPRDAAGPMVHDLLVQRELPPDVEVIDGGLAGLNLLRHVDGAERVVFVDAVSSCDVPYRVVLLDVDDAARQAGTKFDHSAGLAYLLRVLPQVCDGAIPEVLLVGIQGAADQGAIAAAADLSLTVAADGHDQDCLTRTALSGAGA